MKKKTPDYLDKVSPIIGDCIQSNLGINEQDREVIKNEVNKIFLS